MNYTFLQAGDLHLDAPFRGVGRTSPEVAELLRDASLDALDTLVETAIEREVSFVLICGDLFGDSPSLRAEFHLESALLRLDRAGIGVFITRGPRGAECAWPSRPLPAGVYLLDESKGLLDESDGFFRAGQFIRGGLEGEVGIWGFRSSGSSGSSKSDKGGETPLEISDTEATTSKAASSGAAEPTFRIGVVHTDCKLPGTDLEESFSDGTFSKGSFSEGAFSEGALRRSGFDFWALGSYHEHEIVSAEGPWIVYAGTHQGRSPDFGETGPKGAVLVNVVDGVVNDVELLALDRIRIVSVDVQLETTTSVEGARRRFRAGLDLLRLDHPGRALLIDGCLHFKRGEGGRGRLQGRGTQQSLAADVLALLRQDSEGSFPIGWWNRVRLDASRLESGADDSNDFERELRQLADASVTPGDGDDPLGTLIGDRWKPLEDLGYGRHLKSPTSDERIELLAESTRKALQQLEKEEAS